MNKLLILLTLALSACQETPKTDASALVQNAVEPSDAAKASGLELPNQKLDLNSKTVRGLMTVFPTKIGMMDIKNKSLYLINDQTNSINAAFEKAVAPCHYPAETVYAVLTGQFNGTGEMKLPIFEVSKIDTIAAKTPEFLDQIGVPYEFWCQGTEPFWDIEICNAEGGIFYQNASDGSAYFLPWVAPTKKGNAWVYDIPGNPPTTPPATLTIKPGKGNDGMSEKTYDYTAELKIKGATMKGVAVRGTGKVLGPNGTE